MLDGIVTEDRPHLVKVCLKALEPLLQPVAMRTQRLDLPMFALVRIGPFDQPFDIGQLGLDLIRLLRDSLDACRVKPVEALGRSAHDRWRVADVREEARSRILAPVA
jgi:hypothetical protein